jgi:hypothetical protein
VDCFKLRLNLVQEGDFPMKKRMALALVSCVVTSTAGAILLPSCGVRCTFVACIDSLTLRMTSPDGSSIEQFTGTASYDGGVVRFSCPSTWQNHYEVPRFSRQSPKPRLAQSECAS